MPFMSAYFQLGRVHPSAQPSLHQALADWSPHLCRAGWRSPVPLSDRSLCLPPCQTRSINNITGICFLACAGRNLIMLPHPDNCHATAAQPSSHLRSTAGLHPLFFATFIRKMDGLAEFLTTPPGVYVAGAVSTERSPGPLLCSFRKLILVLFPVFHTPHQAPISILPPVPALPPPFRWS